MRRIVSAVAAALVALWMVALGPLAIAQQLPTPIIAVINMDRILAESEVGKDIAKQVDGIRKKYQATIDEKQAELKSEEEALARQRTVLSQQAFAEKQRDYQEKRIAAQQYVQQITRTADGAVNRALNEVRRTVATILSEMQTEYGFTLVFDSSQVLYGVNRQDLSDVVLKRLNERLPKMPVQLPQ